MTRAEKVTEAQRLRAKGLSVTEIGLQMGVPRSTASTWLRDPDLSKQRAQRQRYQGTCVDCGTPTDGSNGRGPRAAKRCRKCSEKQTVQRIREAARVHRELIERLWAEGKTCREIGAIFDWVAKPSVVIAGMRTRGYNLPHRRPPEVVARIADGNRAMCARRGRAAA